MKKRELAEILLHYRTIHKNDDLSKRHWGYLFQELSERLYEEDTERYPAEEIPHFPVGADLLKMAATAQQIALQKYCKNKGLDPNYLNIVDYLQFQYDWIAHVEDRITPQTEEDT